MDCCHANAGQQCKCSLTSTQVERSKSQLYGNYFIKFSSLLGEDEPILNHIFQMGWFNHQLVVFGGGNKPL